MRFGSGRRGTSEGSSLKVHGVTAHTASQKAQNETKLQLRTESGIQIVLTEGSVTYQEKECFK